MSDEPSNNSPNPKKFLKEVNELMPYLKAQGHIPKEEKPSLRDMNGHAFQKVSRKQARDAGFKNSREANYAINAKKYAEMEHERRANAIGFTVEKELRQMHPIISKFIHWTGWVWLYRLVLISWNVKGGTDEVEGVPNIQCSWINLYRFGRPIKFIRLVWEDHNKKRKVI